MPKVLIELKDATIKNIEATSDDVTVYIFDHDAVSQGGLGELTYYLAQASEPVEVDAVVSEDRLMAALEELIAEGEVVVEELTEEADGEEMVEVEDP